MTGRIQDLRADRGFGWIETDDERFWFHANSLEDLTFGEHLRGQTVEFRRFESPKGLQARYIRRPHD